MSKDFTSLFSGLFAINGLTSDEFDREKCINNMLLISNGIEGTLNDIEESINLVSHDDRISLGLPFSHEYGQLIRSLSTIQEFASSTAFQLMRLKKDVKN